MRTKSILWLFLAWMSIGFFVAAEADARRMGGGRSFGSKPQYNRAAPAPTNPQKGGQQADPGRAGQPGQNSGRPGLFGGVGGMLGGLLMGSMIGSLLFGGGHAGGFGLLDLLVIGGGIFLLFRFLNARRAATAGAGGGMHRQAQAPITMGAPGGGGYAGQSSRSHPEGFDEGEFMEGARAAYIRLQASWDKRDMNDIREFTSPEVWEEIVRQAKEEPEPGRTEIVRLDADLVEVEQAGDRTTVSVLFKALLREDPNEDTPHDVQEIWHFGRSDSGDDSFWRLEGIQQVE